MSDQPKFYHPYKQTAQFADGTTARPIPPHTIARGYLETQPDYFTGKMAEGTAGKMVDVDYIPMPITRDDVVRGGQKYNIYCAVCHGKLGDGAGMIVTRGMVRPPSLVRVDRPMTPREINVQRAAVGHYFDVISHGYGAMYSYDDKVAVDDRWRIAAYVKALQVSQDAGLSYVTMKPPATGDAPVPVQTDSTTALPGQLGAPPRQKFNLQPAGEGSNGPGLPEKSEKTVTTPTTPKE